jgi:hypothetical protein
LRIAVTFAPISTKILSLPFWCQTAAVKRSHVGRVRSCRVPTTSDQPIGKDCTMKTERRWMKSLLAEAANCKTRMPWERGLRRAALIARRNAPAQHQAVPKRATA